jgi:hypothetical protein
MGATPLLADPLRWIWVAIFAAVLVVHLRHVRRMRGAHRLWHGGHAFMALAMAGMLLPAGLGSGVAALGFVSAGGAAGAALVYALLRRWDGARIDLSWVTLVVGLAATAYMCLMTAGVTAAPLTYAAAVWLLCETLGWFADALHRTPGATALRVATVSTPTRRPFLSGEQSFARAVTRVERLALGLLAFGMAYLFVAMQQMPMT